MRRLGWSLVDAVGIQVHPQVLAWVAPWSTHPAPVLAHRPHGTHRAPTTPRAQGSQGERISSLPQIPGCSPGSLSSLDQHPRPQSDSTLPLVHC